MTSEDLCIYISWQQWSSNLSMISVGLWH